VKRHAAAADSEAPKKRVRGGKAAEGKARAAAAAAAEAAEDKAMEADGDDHGSVSGPPPFRALVAVGGCLSVERRIEGPSGGYLSGERRATEAVFWIGQIKDLAAAVHCVHPG
jgi:hypothetical protein